MEMAFQTTPFELFSRQFEMCVHVSSKNFHSLTV
jgi:hypothetical protein